MAIPLKMLRLSKGMEFGRVVSWRKDVGEPVCQGEALLELETDKSIVEIEAPASGVLLQVTVADGEEVPVGTVLGWLGEPGESPSESILLEEREGSANRKTSHATQKPARPAASQRPATRRGRFRATPAVRRLAAQHGIDLNALKHSESGRITRADVEVAIQTQQELNGAVEQPTDLDTIPLVGIRKVMAQRMAHSAHTTAAATTFVDVDMHSVVQLKRDQPVTYTSVVVKAVGLAMPNHRILNASLEGDKILLHRTVNVGVAVDSPQGLVVVTVAAVDSKSLAEVDRQLRHLSSQTRQRGATARILDRPTFTVTNSGVLGSIMFTPIINPPQSGTLGMGKIQDTPVVHNGQIVIRPIMYLALTYDHRIVTGSEAVGFLQAVKTRLEEPTAYPFNPENS